MRKILLLLVVAFLFSCKNEKSGFPKTSTINPEKRKVTVVSTYKLVHCYALAIYGNTVTYKNKIIYKPKNNPVAYIPCGKDMKKENLIVVDSVGLQYAIKAHWEIEKLKAFKAGYIHNL